MKQVKTSDKMLIVDRIMSIFLWSKIFRAILAQHLYLYLAQHQHLNSEFVFFLSSFLDYLLSPCSTQTSFIKVLLGNKFGVYFSVPIQISHEKNLQILFCILLQMWNPFKVM